MNNLSPSEKAHGAFWSRQREQQERGCRAGKLSVGVAVLRTEDRWPGAKLAEGRPELAIVSPAQFKATRAAILEALDKAESEIASPVGMADALHFLLAAEQLADRAKWLGRHQASIREAEQKAERESAARDADREARAEAARAELRRRHAHQGHFASLPEAELEQIAAGAK